MWKFFVLWKKSRQSWVEVGKVYDWKKTIKVARRFQNVFPEPQWILCPRLVLDDLGSGEAGNCVGALTIENRQKILSDLKTFYSYAWMVHETSIFSIFPPRITRHASHASFRSKALRRLIILGTRHPVRRKWSNILGPVGSAKLKPTSKLIPLSVDIYISLNIHENQLASLDIYVCEACLFFVCL